MPGGWKSSTTGPGAASATASWMPRPCPLSADSLAVGTRGCSALLKLTGLVLDPGGWIKSSVGKVISLSGNVLRTLGNTPHALQRKRLISRVKVTFCLCLCVHPQDVGCCELYFILSNLTDEFQIRLHNEF